MDAIPRIAALRPAPRRTDSAAAIANHSTLWSAVRVSRRNEVSTRLGGRLAMNSVTARSARETESTPRSRRRDLRATRSNHPLTVVTVEGVGRLP
ncbi:hypothetical protein GCM10025792_39050 [Pseudonocardia tropica]